MIDDITTEEQLIHDLRVEIKRGHQTLGRIFQKGLITSDMIAEALDADAHEEQWSYDTIKIIYRSWGGEAHYTAKACAEFLEILKTIRSYQ